MQNMSYLEVWSCLFVVVNLQIAPAESPDVTERMVIITGPPEAQFKVKKNQEQQSISTKEQLSTTSIIIYIYFTFEFVTDLGYCL